MRQYFDLDLSEGSNILKLATSVVIQICLKAHTQL